MGIVKKNAPKTKRESYVQLLWVVLMHLVGANKEIRQGNQDQFVDSVGSDQM